MHDIKKIADSAEMIINGYAFIKKGKNISVLNLAKPDNSTVIDINGDVLETSMDDIELDIISDYYTKNRKYMEAYNAFWGE